MKYLRATFYILMAILIGFVAISNSTPVQVNLIPSGLGVLPEFSVNLPLFVVILAAIAFGVLVAYLLFFGRSFAASRAKSKAERALRKTEAELEKVKRKSGETDDEVLAILK